MAKPKKAAVQKLKAFADGPPTGKYDFAPGEHTEVAQITACSEHPTKDAAQGGAAHMAKPNSKIMRQWQQKSKHGAPVQHASMGSAYVGPRQMFEEMVRHMSGSPRNDVKCQDSTGAPTWEEGLPYVEDGEVGVFIRSEPIGKGFGVTMRVTSPSAIRNGEFYTSLAAYDRTHGISTLDRRKPVVAKVLRVDKVAEMRRLLNETGESTSAPVPLDDVTVGGEVGVLIFSEPIPGYSDKVRVEVKYVTPAEARKAQS